MGLQHFQLAVLLVGGAAAAQPARPDCTGPINDAWRTSPVTFGTTAYSGTGAHTDTEWEATTTAGNYNTPVFSVTNGATRSYTRSTGFTTGTRYYWHARHRNAQGWSPLCPEERFRFDNVNPTPPGTPQVAYTDAGMVTFSFTAGTDSASGVDGYSLYELNDAGTLYAFEAATTGFTRRIGPGTYRWQARTLDVAGNDSNASGTSVSVTVPADPTLPVLDAPAVTPFIRTTQAFDIELPPDAGTAQLVLARRVDFLSHANTTVVTGGTTSQNPGSDGVWQWRISLISGARLGAWSAWSMPVYRDNTDPSPPTQLSATPPVGPGPVQLAWDAGVDPGTYGTGVSGYLVERRVPGGAWVALLAMPAGTSHSDDAPEGRWEYRVATSDRAGNLSNRTPASSTVAVDRTPPSSPAPVVASATGFLVEVSWSAATDTASGLAEYRLERREASSTAWEPVTSTTELGATHVVTAGRWAYRVTAVDFAGFSTSAESSALDVAGLPLAEACSANDECASGACVHGRCCEAACASCDPSGQCPLDVKRTGCTCGTGAGPAWLLLLLALTAARGASRSR